MLISQRLLIDTDPLTPGQRKNHTVFHLEVEGWVFSGDPYVDEKRILVFRVDEKIDHQALELYEKGMKEKGIIERLRIKNDFSVILFTIRIAFFTYGQIATQHSSNPEVMKIITTDIIQAFKQNL